MIRAWLILIGAAVGTAVPSHAVTQRVANTTLAFPGVPPATAATGYTVAVAFPSVVFTNPIAIASPPGETNRLFVVERAGRIVVITNLAAPTRTVFMNIQSRVNTTSEGGLLGLAFHPGFATNGRFFCFYTTTATNGTGTGFHTRASEFRVSPTNANAFDPSFERILFSQFNDAANHNAGDLHFGPDGYLYIGTGDEGGGNDNYNNSQVLDRDFFSGLMRIDVDFRPGSLPPNPHPALGAGTNYAVPPDNWLVGVTNYLGSNLVPHQVRTEFWAHGFRNPFRFTFDPRTGRLLLADVGQNAWEEVNWVTNGGNYGWAHFEGFAPGPKPTPHPASAYTRPLLTYAHGTGTNKGNSITGGIVYYGDRMPELVGNYIFADYVRGNVWAMTDNGVTNTSFKWLTSLGSVVGFGRDPRNGDVLMAKLDGQVFRLLPLISTSGVPAQLSAAGIFSNLVTLSTHPGILPYDVNVPFWADGASKKRWFSIPSTNLHMVFHPEQSWTFPTGTVWIKHFEIETTAGVPSSVRRLETRVLVKTDAPDGGYGLTYRWGESGTEAFLVPEHGLEEPIHIVEGGTVRTQIWQYPSRLECLACHNSAAGFAVGFQTPQLHRDFAYGPTDVTNQIRRLAALGYFQTNVVSVTLLRALVPPTNQSVSLEQRARSYLAANCAHCHLPGGPVPSGFDTRIFTPLSATHMIEGSLANNFGNTNNRVIRRGAPAQSMIHTRMAIRGPGQMPPVGSTIVDTQGVALIAAWIGSLTSHLTFAEWQSAHFGSPANPDAGLDRDPDGDGEPNHLEYLLKTQPTNAASARGGLEISPAWHGGPRLRFVHVANRGVRIEGNNDLSAGEWTPLDISANRPHFPAVDEEVMVDEALLGAEPAQSFRAIFYEP
ncbi:MAG: PQQ-dependent sugar dehydrogenase [Kiritimatiellae bacterium]|nr:PQQ-dependent sugar dehydrogenase [Kiritimatiellia bacterium]MDW8458828.1 PQQ-dependent sugar dehydrogenase [Verrucomicrobiota bacterium]